MRARYPPAMSVDTPLRFVPIPRPRVWGGRRLETIFGRALPPGEPVGESWDLADLPGAVSVVASGAHAGRTLHDLVEAEPGDLLGRAQAKAGRFPLLVKLLDAHRTLSVQVHPDEAAAARLGGDAKDEAWFVLNADPGAALYLGLKPGTGRAELARSVEDGEVASLLAPCAPRPGDVIHVPPGTVHALGDGVVLVEVQQPSDTTYRLFDWGRLGSDGRPRALQVEKALEAIHFGSDPRGPVAGGCIDSPAFRARWVRGQGGGEEPAADLPRVVIATGAGTLAWRGTEEALRYGDTVLLPAACGDVEVRGADYVRVEVPPGGRTS